MKQGKWPKGVLQFTNNIRQQVSHLRDHYHGKINRSIVPIVKELYEKNINPLVYSLWPHSAQQWEAWVPGFMSEMWSSVWRNENERIEFMKWMGQDLMNNKMLDQMDELLERYAKICTQKSVRNLFCVLPIKWMPRSLKEPKEEQQTNLRENAVYFMNCQTMDHDKPEVVIISDPPIATTPATGSEGIIQEEKLIEIVETETEKQPGVEKLTEQIKEMPNA
uniref:Uncharacterized protein n=1 Tax=Romanomermis culicivorax TaxID=13658 RepID=A0A915L3K7_ROMCU